MRKIIITKNYIKQCEKSKDLQKICKYEGGDHFINVAQEIEIMPFGLTEKMKEWYKYYYHTWLPSQEQLQEMIHTTDWHGVLVAFLCWWGEGVDIEEITSMNELWLAFVMKEKYNKMWNGKDWVIR